MSVLIECFNVIVMREAAERQFPGGLEAYRRACLDLNSTFCADGHLTRIGFMARRDVRAFAQHVLSVANLGGEAEGDSFWIDGRSVAVVEQFTGPWEEPDHGWLECREGPQGVCWCWLKGTEPGAMATPPGWYPDPTMVQLDPTVARANARAEEGTKTIRLWHARVFPDSEGH